MGGLTDILGTGGGGTTADSLLASSKTATSAGIPLVQAGVSGKGTPFQQAAVKSYVTSSMANMNAYEKQAGAKDIGTGGAANILQNANVMLEGFTTSDIQTGAGFLESAIQSSTKAQEIQQAQSQELGQAVMSAAEIVAMIMIL